MSWRQLIEPREIATKTRRHQDARSALVLLRVFVSSWRSVLALNFSHLPRTKTSQERLRTFDIELRIGRLNAQKETIARSLFEIRHVEHRMIRLRQTVQRQHPEHRRECG